MTQDCADLLQRSSSCVEGRNGQLSLRHHSLHRITPARLQALTAVHNYFIHRPDGMTAAERFFGTAPADFPTASAGTCLRDPLILLNNIAVLPAA